MSQDPDTPLLPLRISASDSVPIYIQIVNQIGYLIASGRLTPGQELPPIRVLAERLVVNPNTVAQAYRKLEDAGMVEKRRTSGTYVAEASSPLADSQRKKILTDRIDALLVEARQLNFSVPKVLALVEQCDAKMREGQPA